MSRNELRASGQFLVLFDELSQRVRNLRNGLNGVLISFGSYNL